MNQNEIMDPQVLFEAMANRTEVAPPRVTMAFNCLCWARTISQGFAGLDAEGTLRTTGRKLTLSESGVYTAALECLRVYLNGEMFELPNYRKDGHASTQDG